MLNEFIIAPRLVIIKDGKGQSWKKGSRGAVMIFIIKIICKFEFFLPGLGSPGGKNTWASVVIMS